MTDLHSSGHDHAFGLEKSGLWHIKTWKDCVQSRTRRPNDVRRNSGLQRDAMRFGVAEECTTLSHGTGASLTACGTDSREERACRYRDTKGRDQGWTDEWQGAAEDEGRGRGKWKRAHGVAGGGSRSGLRSTNTLQRSI